MELIFSYRLVNVEGIPKFIKTYISYKTYVMLAYIKRKQPTSTLLLVETQYVKDAWPIGHR